MAEGVQAVDRRLRIDERHVVETPEQGEASVLGLGRLRDRAGHGNPPEPPAAEKLLGGQEGDVVLGGVDRDVAGGAVGGLADDPLQRDVHVEIRRCQHDVPDLQRLPRRVGRPARDVQLAKGRHHDVGPAGMGDDVDPLEPRAAGQGPEELLEVPDRKLSRLAVIRVAPPVRVSRRPGVADRHADPTEMMPQPRDREHRAVEVGVEPVDVDEGLLAARQRQPTRQKRLERRVGRPFDGLLGVGRPRGAGLAQRGRLREPAGLRHAGEVQRDARQPRPTRGGHQRVPPLTAVELHRRRSERQRVRSAEAVMRRRRHAGRVVGAVRRIEDGDVTRPQGRRHVVEIARRVLVNRRRGTEIVDDAPDGPRHKQQRRKDKANRNGQPCPHARIVPRLAPPVHSHTGKPTPERWRQAATGATGFRKPVAPSRHPGRDVRGIAQLSLSFPMFAFASGTFSWKAATTSQGNSSHSAQVVSSLPTQQARI